MSVSITLIAAVARNNVIGDHGRIPWRLPSDMAHFKRTTLGAPVIMGRKQYELFGRPLPGRANIVVTRQAGYAAEGITVAASLESALMLGRDLAAEAGREDVFVIGGGEIYAQAMPLADRLVISHVELAPEGDAVFPPIDPALWQVVSRPVVEPSPKDEATYTIAIYERKRRAAD
jgi:dihydrofolate reductase